MKRLKMWFYAIALVILGAVWLVADSGDYWTSGFDSATGYSPWRVNSSKNLIPGVTNTSSIGESSYRPSTVYGVNGDLSGTLAVTGYSTLKGIKFWGVSSSTPTSQAAGDLWISTNGSNNYLLKISTTISSSSAWVTVGDQVH